MAAEDDDIPTLGALFSRLMLGLLGLGAVFAALAWTVREPLEATAAWFVNELGLFGVFALVAVVDSLPLTHEPILFLGWKGGLGFWEVWAAASAGSVLAGINGWALGRYFSRWAWLSRQFERYRVTGFMERYGTWAIAIAATTPFPYGLATWCSGTARLPFLPVLIGCLFRLPKVLFYLSLIAGGWHLPSLFEG